MPTQPRRSVRLLKRAAFAVLSALCTGALVSTIAGAAGLTVTRLASTNNPSNDGQPVIFIAAVLAENAAETPTGSITFSDGTKVLGNVPLDGNGRATLTTSSLAAGSHAIAAAYMPADPRLFSGSSATLTQNVASTTAVTTTTMLTSAPNPSSIGQPVTFAATVKSNNGTPTGTVAFADGATALGTASLDGNGQATFATSTLTVGSHNIAANYRGDPNFPGASTTLTQTVNPKKTGTVTALRASRNPSRSGENVTFIASVTPNGGSSLPTGTVTFLDGSTVLGTEPLNQSGRIGFATSKLAVGRHFITANYNGDGDFAGSQSNALTQTVHQ